MPETCWLTPSATVSNAMTSPARTPLINAASTPTHKLPEK
jgi:hypothetical protein